MPPNPFNGWHFDKAELKKEIIYEQEFEELLKFIDTKPKFFSDAKGKRRNMYYTWLKDAFSLALFCGGRRQEIPEIKWTDIIANRKTGNIKGGVLKLRDIKVSKIQNLSQVKIKPIEINQDLYDLLMRMGYEKNKGLDKYLIDPDENCSREIIKNCLSRSFAYYISFVKTGGRKLEFKCLRKTWFTSCAAAVGTDMASFMGGHSDSEVTTNHYFNDLELAGASGKFEKIFQ